MDSKMDNKEVLMREVSIIRRIYNKDCKIVCRKCRDVKDPIIKNGVLADFNSTAKEQYISGICSDKCWDDCKEDEIMLFKFIAPLYLHKDCVIQKVNITDPKTYKCVEIDHNKNPIYQKSI